VLRRLEQYRRFLESSRDYIITAALDLVFREDKSFVAWLETQQASSEVGGSSFAADAPQRTSHGARPDTRIAASLQT
jgi:hypothetical protein